MKLLSSVAVLLAAASNVSAHYIFIQFSTGGTTFPQYTYIRKNTNYNSPVTGTARALLQSQDWGSGFILRS